MIKYVSLLNMGGCKVMQTTEYSDGSIERETKFLHSPRPVVKKDSNGNTYEIVVCRKCGETLIVPP